MLRFTALLAIVLAAATLCPASAGPRHETAIIVPKSAPRVVDYAARELQYYVEKSTGVMMPILTEGSVPTDTKRRIYLGATQAAREAGIDPSVLPRDAYHIRKSGDTVYLVGGDRDGDPLAFGTPAGTLFAVYDVLDSDLGVRWLWPGRSGEYIPRRLSLRIRDRDETVQPRFRFCGLRTGRTEERRWMRRMRMHGADGISYGHAFEDWDDRYFADHSDWFEMDRNGVRHRDRSMCVSNPGFHRQIVQNWWAEQRDRPAPRRNVNVCENDGPGACRCPTCLSWDGPEPSWPRPTPYDNVHNVSERYARFAMEVLRLAREHDPNVEVTCYAYSNLTFAPRGVTLDKSVLVGYVPDVFFPRTAESQDWVLAQGLGWIKSGASLFLRPNYLLHGYCMPVNWARQSAEEFKFLEARGMVGTDFDSLTGMWSTMGLSLYVVGRLHATPKASADRILQEYYASFGPAAKQVEAYWDYWERYSLEHIDVFKDGLWHYARYPETAAKRFPPECFAPAAKLLDEAERAASKNRDAAAKVAFLKTGLEHAKLCVEASIAFENAKSDDARWKAAAEKLQAFRRTIADPMVVNISDGNSSCMGRETNLGWWPK